MSSDSQAAFGLRHALFDASDFRELRPVPSDHLGRRRAADDASLINDADTPTVGDYTTTAALLTGDGSPGMQIWSTRASSVGSVQSIYDGDLTDPGVQAGLDALSLIQVGDTSAVCRQTGPAGWSVATVKPGWSITIDAGPLSDCAVVARALLLAMSRLP